jgi:hypothetical protein
LSDYKIFDNFLPDNEFQAIYNTVKKAEFGWAYNEYVSEYGNVKDENFYFTHTMYAWGSPTCPSFNEVIIPVEKVLREKANIQIKAMLRMKANLYTRTETLIQHGMHMDYDYSHTACILGMNDCDGFTILENKSKIESKANRMLIFDGSNKHCSTSCTDQKVRINISFNLL